MAKPGCLGRQWKIYHVLVNLPSLGEVFSLCFFVLSLELPISTSGPYILLFPLKSPFSASCLLPMKALARCNEATLQPFFSNRSSCAIHSPSGTSLSFHVISQNHRLAEVGRHLWRPSSPTASSKQGYLEKAAQDCL